MGAGIRAGRAFVELSLDDSRFGRGIGRVQRQMSRFASSLRNVGASLALTGGALALPLAGAVRTFAEFDDIIKELEAKSVGQDVSALTEEIRRLGRTTSFTAREAGQAAVELRKLGFEPPQIEEALQAILDLARGTASTLPDAARVAGRAINQFGLTASDTTHIADVFTFAINNSALTLESLEEGISKIAPLGALAGESLESITAQLAILADRAIEGSLAGTGLQRALKNLASQAGQKDLEEIFKGGGALTGTAEGDFRRLVEIIGDIFASTEDLGNVERIGIFDQIFGRGAATAANIGSSADAVRGFQRRLETLGPIARDTAETMDSGLGGALRILRSAWESLRIEIGKILSGVLQTLAGQLTTLLNLIEGLAKSFPGVIIGVAGVAAAITVVGVALTVAGFALTGLVAGFKLMIGIFTSFISVVKLAVAAFLAIPAVIVPVIVGIGVISGLLVAGIAVWKAYGEQIKNTVTAQIPLFGQLLESFKTVVKGIFQALSARQFALAAQIAMEGLKLGFETGFVALRNIVDTFITFLRKKFLEGAANVVQVFTMLVADIGRVLGPLDALLKRVFGISVTATATEFGRNVEKALRGGIDVLEDDLDKRIRDRNRSLTERVNKIQDLQRKAQRALDKANEPRTDDGLIDPSQLFFNPDTTQGPGSRRAGAAMASAAGRAFASFSGLAASRRIEDQGREIQKKMQIELKKTAENTKIIADASKKGLAFA